MTASARPREHLAAIGVAPRAAGGASEARARRYCGAVLERSGFAVRTDDFEYSAFPGRFATPLAGFLSTTILLGSVYLAAAGRFVAAGVCLAVGAVAVGLGSLWVARSGILQLRVMRRVATNLQAVRGADRPQVWLVAHLDSKSQPVPILVRAVAIAAHVATWVAVIVLWLLELGAVTPAATWPTLGVAALASGLPIMATVVGDRSAGAVDNASGVAAVLGAATLLPPTAAVGVMLTSAEELGLAGARAWARTDPPSTALNCDGIDDDGELVCMYSGRRPVRLTAAFERVAQEQQVALSVRRLLPGILVDGVALADAGWDVVTLSRGSARTLARVHTTKDSLAMLSGRGVDEAAALLARVAVALA